MSSAVVRAAEDMGVHADFPNDLTLALGTTPMTLLDLTAAYAGVAAGQTPVTPYGVPQVRVAPTRQLPRTERDGLLDLLRAAVTFGTGNVGNVSPYAYGKTGTTQDYRDALFVGFVGDMVIGVWVGNDDNSPMNGVAGAGLPAEIWRDFARYSMARGAVRVNGRQIGMAPVAPRPPPVEELPLDVPPPEDVVPPIEGEAPPAETAVVPPQPVEPAPQPAAPPPF